MLAHYQGNLVELSRRQPDLLRDAKESDDLFATLNYGTQVMAHLQLAGDQPSESLRRLEEDNFRLSDRGFFIQHHNFVLAKTYTLLYQDRAAEALATIDGQWGNHRREFLSQIQKVRIDHRQVMVRALIAAAAQGQNRERNLSRARRLIGSLRSERAGGATALATAFQAACDHLANKQQQACETLNRASHLLKHADMRLFAVAAGHHLTELTGEDNEQLESRWHALGVANSVRMASMLLPGFSQASGR